MGNSPEYFTQFYEAQMTPKMTKELHSMLQPDRDVDELRKELKERPFPVPDDQLQTDEQVIEKARALHIRMKKKLTDDQEKKITQDYLINLFLNKRKSTTYRNQPLNDAVFRAQTKGNETTVKRMVEDIFNKENLTRKKYEYTMQGGVKEDPDKFILKPLVRDPYKGKLKPLEKGKSKVIDLTEIVRPIYEKKRDIPELDIRPKINKVLQRLDKDKTKRLLKDTEQALDKAIQSGNAVEINALNRKLLEISQEDRTKRNIPSTYNLGELIRKSTEARRKLERNPFALKSDKDIALALELEGIKTVGLDRRKLRIESLAQSLRERGVNTSPLNENQILQLAKVRGVTLRNNAPNKWDLIVRVKELSPPSDVYALRELNKDQLSKELKKITTKIKPPTKAPWIRASDLRPGRKSEGFGSVYRAIRQLPFEAEQANLRKKLKEQKELIGKEWSFLPKKDVNELASQEVLADIYRDTAPIAEVEALRRFKNLKYKGDQKKILGPQDWQEFVDLPITTTKPGAPSLRKLTYDYDRKLVGLKPLRPRGGPPTLRLVGPPEPMVGPPEPRYKTVRARPMDIQTLKDLQKEVKKKLDEYQSRQAKLPGPKVIVEKVVQEPSI
jgi:hypothetical protein